MACPPIYACSAGRRARVSVTSTYKPATQRQTAVRKGSTTVGATKQPKSAASPAPTTSIASIQAPTVAWADCVSCRKTLRPPLAASYGERARSCETVRVLTSIARQQSSPVATSAHSPRAHHRSSQIAKRGVRPSETHPSPTLRPRGLPAAADLRSPSASRPGRARSEPVCRMRERRRVP